MGDILRLKANLPTYPLAHLPAYLLTMPTNIKAQLTNLFPHPLTPSLTYSDVLLLQNNFEAQCSMKSDPDAGVNAEEFAAAFQQVWPELSMSEMKSVFSKVDATADGLPTPTPTPNPNPNPYPTPNQGRRHRRRPPNPNPQPQPLPPP